MNTFAFAAYLKSGGVK